MTISGFTFVRNADKFYFPIKESIMSILPIVDEFIVALGNCDDDDRTLALIESIGSDKIKIYHRVWDEQAFVDGKIFADETNFAMQQCKGDWCFYIQADEVIHENDLPVIQAACAKHLHHTVVDGLLFKYYHFFADYEHYMPFHGWYKNEIRIVRNHSGIYSYKDAQSFRKGANEKLRVCNVDAHVYHYGWVRPPRLMQAKKKEQDEMYHDKQRVQDTYRQQSEHFDFGALGRIPLFKGEHPAVMADFISRMDWKAQLNYSNMSNAKRPKLKHERLKNRVLSFLENNLNGGKEIAGYSNWYLV